MILIAVFLIIITLQMKEEIYLMKILKLKNITAKIPENIDHIVMSENFIERFKIKISEFNLDKKLSDHKGIIVELISL